VATVVDAMGRPVWQGELDRSGTDLGLPSGSYTVSLSTAAGVVRQRLLIH
jgi:hypothetical protein